MTISSSSGPPSGPSSGDEATASASATPASAPAHATPTHATPGRRVGTDDRKPRLPLHSLLAAFDAWQDDPTPERRRSLGKAFGDVLESNGIHGGFLRVFAPPLPAIGVGTGTVPSAPSDQHALSLHRFPLMSLDRALGELWLDVPPGDADAFAAAEECASALDVAVDAAWSRVRARLAVEELKALDTATRAIAGVLDLDRVLQLITDRVRVLVNAQYAALGIVDQEGLIERFFTSGLTRAERERIGPLPRGHGLLGVIVRENRALRIPDIEEDHRRYGFPPNHPEMHSLLGVPVGMKGHSIGRLYMTNKLPAGQFTEDDQRLVETFALHASIAIENARLHEQVQRLAIVEERERIGRDLHDGIIQSIYAVGLGLEDVPDLMEDEPDVARARVERAIESLDQTIRDIRNFIFGLRPELLEQAGLAGGLAALADEFRVNSLVDVDLDTSAAEDAELPADLTGQLLSIAREALSNIARHSKATRGSVHVVSGDGDFRLVISDNGVGFDPARPRGPSHQGLVNMAARTAEFGGRLEIDSAAGRGTRIIVVIPNRATDGSDDSAVQE